MCSMIVGGYTPTSIPEPYGPVAANCKVIALNSDFVRGDVSSNLDRMAISFYAYRGDPMDRSLFQRYTEILLRLAIGVLANIHFGYAVLIKLSLRIA